jgi:RHS repeat-associated protein
MFQSPPLQFTCFELGSWTRMGSSNDRGSNRFEVAIVLADFENLSRQHTAILRPTIHPPVSTDQSESNQPSYHRNQQYSIIGLTNAAGTLVERYSYSAYGTLGIYDASGTVRTTSTYANRYTYTGREYDPDLNLYHFRARWYDPATGGFISRDPLGYVDGMSLYRGYFGVKSLDTYGTVECACTSVTTTTIGRNQGEPSVHTKFEYSNDADCSSLNKMHVVGGGHVKKTCVPSGFRYMSQYERNFMEWYSKEVQDLSWTDEIPACPCSIMCTVKHRCFDRSTRSDKTWTTKSICNPAPDIYTDPDSAWNPTHKFFITELWGSYHDGGHYEIRTKSGKHGNQCIYDSDGNLITKIPTAGSADKVSPNSTEGSHMNEDVYPFDWAKVLGEAYIRLYFEVRPVNGGKPCQQYDLDRPRQPRVGTAK